MKCNSNAYFNALIQKTNKLKNTSARGNELNAKFESTQKTGYFTDFYDSQGNVNDELFQEWLECSGYNNQYLEYYYGGTENFLQTMIDENQVYEFPQKEEERGIFNKIARIATGVFMPSTIPIMFADEVLQTNLVDKGLNSLDEKYHLSDCTEATIQTVKNSDSVSDFLKRQDYISANFIRDINNGEFNLDNVEMYNNTYEQIKDAGRNEKFEIVEHDLTDEQLQFAMSFAIELLQQRIDSNAQYFPEYGDCKSYYNEGKMTDWLFLPGFSVMGDRINIDYETSNTIAEQNLDNEDFDKLSAKVDPSLYSDEYITTFFNGDIEAYMEFVNETLPDDVTEPKQKEKTPKEPKNNELTAFYSQVIDENNNVDYEAFDKWRKEWYGDFLSDEYLEEAYGGVDQYINSLIMYRQSSDRWKMFAESIGECHKEEGHFLLQDIPSRFASKLKPGEEGVRVAYATDIIQIHSTNTISTYLDEQKQLLEQLIASQDDYNKFSEIFYQISNGINFDPNEVLEYFEMVKNGDIQYSEEAIIGRNFIQEDITKNRLGSNILFEVNKSVGTSLCKKIPYGIGYILAPLINFGTTILENNTQGDKEYKLSDFEIFFQEGIRSFFGLFGEDIAKNVIGYNKPANYFKYTTTHAGSSAWTARGAGKFASKISSNINKVIMKLIEKEH